MRNRLRSTAVNVAAALLCTAALMACRPQPPQDPGTDNRAEAKRTLPPLPIVEPPLDRARLLLAVARAASAHTAGADDLAAQRKLDGKQFEVRLRFGCDGQGPGQGEHGWSIDPDGQTLRLRAVPTLSLKDKPVGSVAGKGVEAAEGFWLSRPWLLTAACPKAQAGVEIEPPSAEKPAAEEDETSTTRPDAPAVVQRVGIARFFTREDSRTGRRIERPFEAVVQLKAGDPTGLQGFNLVLSGRLRGQGDNRVIRCTGSGRERPPDCIISADVDRVWIERPEDKKVMAEWTI